MAARRSPRARALGQHFLRARYASSLVARARFRPGELVVDIGAGRGSITAELVRRGARVVAVEIDPRLAAVLRERFGDAVEVVEGDAASVALPEEPFRVVANVPFGDTTRLLRRLLDDASGPLERADLIVQWEVARKRAAQRPGTLLSLSWAPWWELSVAGRLPASAFSPRPRVDAGILVARRRADPLLAPNERPRYVRLLRAGFAAPTLRRAGIPTPRALKRAAARELRVEDWVAVYRLVATGGTMRT